MNRQDAKTPRIATHFGRDSAWREPDARTDALAYQVIGAAIEVHKQLGPGWLESAYEEALCVELSLHTIPFVRQHPVFLSYKGRKVREGHVDLLIADCLVVELKAVSALTDIHTAQTLSYLRLTKCKLGLLINFHVAVLRNGIERVVLSVS